MHYLNKEPQLWHSILTWRPEVSFQVSLQLQVQVERKLRNNNTVTTIMVRGTARSISAKIYSILFPLVVVVSIGTEWDRKSVV